MAVVVQKRRYAPRFNSEKIKRMAEAICHALFCPRAELSIVLTGDVEIRALNRDFRGKDKATDVLSFSQLENIHRRGAKARRLLRPDSALGDVVISVETARRQALEFGHSLEEELRRLLVHGVLHLLGHDHVHGGRQAALMIREEKRLHRMLTRMQKKN